MTKEDLLNYQHNLMELLKHNDESYWRSIGGEEFVPMTIVNRIKIENEIILITIQLIIDCYYEKK